MTIENLHKQLGALVLQLWEKDEAIGALVAERDGLAAQLAPAEETGAPVQLDERRRPHRADG